MRRMTVREFAEYTNLSVASVYGKIKDGVFTSCKIGDLWYIELDDETLSKIQCSTSSKYITVTELAKDLKISRQAIHAKRKKIQSIKEGKKVYFLRSDVEKYLRREDASFV